MPRLNHGGLFHARINSCPTHPKTKDDPNTSLKNQIAFARRIGIKVGPEWDRSRDSNAIGEVLARKPEQRERAARIRAKAEKQIAFQTYGEALVAERSKWDDLHGQYGLMVYRKNEVNVMDVVCVSDCELIRSMGERILSIKINLSGEKVIGRESFCSGIRAPCFVRRTF